MTAAGQAQGSPAAAGEGGTPGAVPAARRLARAALWVAGAAVLALVALAYLNPHLMLDIADQLWACF